MRKSLFTKDEVKRLRSIPRAIVDGEMTSPLNPERVIRITIHYNVLGDNWVTIAKLENMDAPSAMRAHRRWEDWARRQPEYKRLAKELKAKAA